MDYFPIFLKLADEPVVVVGGGEVAARKIDLLLRTGAKVTVVAPELIESLASLAAAGSIVHLAAEFQPEHLNGARIAIAATDKHSINAWVAHQAERRNIPVNVVDDRELSRFIVPAIVDRSPVVVAVASSGDAPVLTRRLREKLETFLPQRLGVLAKLAGKLRPAVKARVEEPAARRRFWERFFDGPLASDLLAGRSDAATVEARVEESLRAASESAKPVGEVVLVGAGPGDPGLLTLRALRALQNADVVLYDRLVSTQIVDLARRDAERIYVGKAPGDAHASQEQINALLVKLARQGKRVCRLKGGDPFIFGRGGEELETLAAEGIRFEVVPGITAAAGCAAYAGIPLTHRDYAQSLTFVTGHCKGETDKVDWDLLARPGQTVVFYMGLGHLESIVARLRERGVPAERAAAIIEHGTQATQRVVTGTLADLVHKAGEARIESPALLIVGEVTRLHDALHWFNANGQRGDEISALAFTNEGRLSA
ncbi:uroporphyrin-III C-methyltransferase/precorrin-2 dehydrogenase/sirohydrochlorin ferrochelatase [Povalibacter uvarum]|uniref:Siroheme synthase n=1 Tax=Povalibacter uvarum TaxID=732238 RepID=A0A841HMP8_9GAMM|nr:siroheme synthase CysG [Povalibacter uvarum]MBB6093550.1 uroporphyrin-III C-methyltransferase/precorrin-2 dehydrogenase/sirohydrochlorin ferrochelatase [Povalibacter uvarum]